MKIDNGIRSVINSIAIVVMQEENILLKENPAIVK